MEQDPELQQALEGLNFDDLYEKYRVESPNNLLDRFVLIDGAPIAPEKKLPMLIKVLKKTIEHYGKVVPDGIVIPTENGKSKGFVFVEFASAEGASKAVKAHKKKLDAKHTLIFNPLDDINDIKDTEEMEPVEPEIEPYHELPFLQSWLTDYSGRDQYYIYNNDSVAVHWNGRTKAEVAMEKRDKFTTVFTSWSPKGSYLCSIHAQGVQTWGGPEFGRIARFVHRGVRLFDFSPCENYLVTISHEPIVSSPGSLFGPESEGHKIVVWNIKTSLPIRTFPAPSDNQEKKVWPILKWSFDDKYFARQTPGQISIYEALSDSANLLDKKSLKIEDVMDFEWSPAAVHLADSKNKVDHILCYWTPENVNQTARVSLLEVPSKRIIRTRNLFNVSDCKFHWQDQGKYLCVKVDRHTKTKKTTFTNLEFYRINDKDIPVEVIELKDTVINLAWEPKGNRLVTISRHESVNLVVNTAVPRNTVTFYAPEIKSTTKANAGLQKWKSILTIPGKHTNIILFSPTGRFVVTSAILPSNTPEIDFYDFDFEDKKEDETVAANLKHIGSVEFLGLTDLEWDPSGRFIAGWSSIWRHHIENGYKIFDFRGQALRAESLDQFKCFAWRPRPASLLSNSAKKKIQKNLKEFSRKFEEDDLMEQSAANREIILNRRRLLEEWKTWREKTEAKLREEGYEFKEKEEDEEDDSNFQIIEEISEELLDEKEEIVKE